MATSLIIESKDLYDKSKQKSITDINPTASTQELLDFSQTLIDLTNNSYVKTTRINKTDLDTPKESVINLWRVITPSSYRVGEYTIGAPTWEMSVTMANAATNLQLRLACKDWQAAAQILDVQSTNDTDWGLASMQWTGPKGTAWQQGLWYGQIGCSELKPCNITFTIKILETEQYAGLDLPVTIHITED